MFRACPGNFEVFWKHQKTSGSCRLTKAWRGWWWWRGESTRLWGLGVLGFWVWARDWRCGGECVWDRSQSQRQSQRQRQRQKWRRTISIINIGRLVWLWRLPPLRLPPLCGVRRRWLKMGLHPRLLHTHYRQQPLHQTQQCWWWLWWHRPACRTPLLRDSSTPPLLPSTRRWSPARTFSWTLSTSFMLLWALA